MVSTLSTGILLLFLSSVAISFFWPFFRERVAQNVKLDITLASVKNLAIFLLPFVMLFAAGQFYDFQKANVLRYLALGAIVPFMLARLHLPPRLIGVLLLTMSVLGWTWMGQNLDAMIALLGGLVVWKVIENTYFQQLSTLEDVLPSAVWLAGNYWIHTVSGESQIPTQQGLILGIISVTILLRVFQGPYLTNDKLYLKRIALSATGGLGVLIVVTKLLLAPALALMAGLVGAGIFMTYLMEGSGEDKEGQPGAAEAVKWLVLIGIFTLLATRLFGTFGLIALAPAVLVATRSGVAMYAGMFFIVRALLQSYLYQYNPNLTGINITHAYAGAALYAGMTIALIISLLLRDSDKRWFSTGVFLLAGAATPMFSNYFLHQEPTGSLLVSNTVACILLVVFAPVLYREQLPTHGTLMVLPLLMIIAALLTSELIAMGNVAETSTKIQILAWLAVALVIISLVGSWLLGKWKGKPVEVSGD